MCVINFSSECPGVFVPDAKINYDEAMDLPPITFNCNEMLSIDISTRKNYMGILEHVLCAWI